MLVGIGYRVVVGGGWLFFSVYLIVFLTPLLVVGWVVVGVVSG